MEEGERERGEQKIGGEKRKEGRKPTERERETGLAKNGEIRVGRKEGRKIAKRLWPTEIA